MTTVLDPTRVADAIADQLADPNDVPAPVAQRRWWRQSLAHGVPGIALLHIERAATGQGPWRRADAWLSAAATGPVTGGMDSHPCYGAPAIAHAIRCAHQHRPTAFRDALERLDRRIHADVQQRMNAAHARLDADQHPVLRDFDALQGLTGYGAYLLRADPHGELLRAVLAYLVRLTQPRIDHDGALIPGWWVASGPSGKPDPRFPHGHANNGMSHGIGGPLTLLALTALARITVHGHTDAITTICRWLDRWQTGPRWPYWITPASLRTGQPAPTDFGRPSWCYGTAGIARAQQLAALALADTTRQHRAEQALVAALDDPAQLAATIDASLCHGYAGLTHLATLVAADAHPATTAALRQRIPYLLHHITRAPDDPADIARALITADRSGPGLLDGAAGTALAIRSTARRPCVAWDAVLLTTSPTTPGVRNSQEASP